jgi:hypothetical protein
LNYQLGTAPSAWQIMPTRPTFAKTLQAMIRPSVRGESYVGETSKSMKALASAFGK